MLLLAQRRYKNPPFQQSKPSQQTKLQTSKTPGLMGRKENERQKQVFPKRQSICSNQEKQLMNVDEMMSEIMHPCDTPLPLQIGRLLNVSKLKNGQRKHGMVTMRSSFGDTAMTPHTHRSPQTFWMEVRFSGLLVF